MANRVLPSREDPAVVAYADMLLRGDCPTYAFMLEAGQIVAAFASGRLLDREAMTKEVSDGHSTRTSTNENPMGEKAHMERWVTGWEPGPWEPFHEPGDV